MGQSKNRYGLFTAITMIVGICIGSGIYFKSDNILAATGGSVFFGILLFVVCAIAVIFGGLCLSSLASRTDLPGGIITYADVFVSKRLACAYGWFQTFIYYPALTVVVAWVVGIYTSILFNLKNTLEQQVLIGFAFVIICFIYNTLSPKFGGMFQNGATIIKLIPLFIIAIGGLIFGDPVAGIKHFSTGEVAAAGWITAIAPIAFSFDGWVISTNIQHEVKNSTKNMPRALIFAPLFVLLAYLLYFTGMCFYVGPEKVLELGDESVTFAATRLLGSNFAKAITVFVLISVMGTVNGVVLGFIRLPYSLALRKGMMPMASKLSKVNKKLDIPVVSAVFAFILSIIWMTIHYFTQKYQLLPNSDVSEIAIACSYAIYIVLYYQVFRFFRKKEIGFVRGVICPIFATLGSALILYGSLMLPNYVDISLFGRSIHFKLVLIYFGIDALVIIISQLYYRPKKHLN